MPAHNIIDNRREKLVDHINLILETSEAARFAVGDEYTYDEIFDDIPTILTIKESSEYLGVAEITMRRWAKEGKLPFHRIGKNYVFGVDDLRKLKRRREER